MQQVTLSVGGWWVVAPFPPSYYILLIALLTSHLVKYRIFSKSEELSSLLSFFLPASPYVVIDNNDSDCFPLDNSTHL